MIDQIHRCDFAHGLSPAKGVVATESSPRLSIFMRMAAWWRWRAEQYDLLSNMKVSPVTDAPHSWQCMQELTCFGDSVCLAWHCCPSCDMPIVMRMRRVSSAKMSTGAWLGGLDMVAKSGRLGRAVRLRCVAGSSKQDTAVR